VVQLLDSRLAGKISSSNNRDVVLAIAGRDVSRRPRENNPDFRSSAPSAVGWQPCSSPGTQDWSNSAGENDSYNLEGTICRNGDTCVVLVSNSSRHKGQNGQVKLNAAHPVNGHIITHT
jgi:hypothetical protein